jgi:hypothetical protein
MDAAITPFFSGAKKNPEKDDFSDPCQNKS